MKRIAMLIAGITIFAVSYSVYIPPDGVGDAVSFAGAANQPVLASSSTTRPSNVMPAEVPVKLDLPLYLDGTLVRLPKPSIVINGSTLVPLRSVFEAMEIAVAWDPENGAVIAEKAGTRLTLKPGDVTATLNSKRVTMDIAGLIYEESMYVPLRFVSESFGTLIGYDRNSGSISISTKPHLKGKVTYLPDGDTLDVLFDDGKSKRVRLIGVNTPESTKEAGIEPGGKVASSYSKSRLLGQTVYVTHDKTDDPYGRMLAYIHLENGEFFNATLVSEGYARIMTIAPNTTWAGYFEDLQSGAQKGRRQLWNPDTYSTLEPGVATRLITDLAEAGITKTSPQLAAPATEGEFAKLLLFTLYPEARLLIAGYKVYEISRDADVQKIIQALKEKEPNGELLNNEQMHKLILLALGIKEESFAAKTLEELGVIPNLDRPVTVGEAIEIVQRIQSFTPTINELEKKVKAIKPDIDKLKSLNESITNQEVLGSVDDALRGLSDMNLADKAKDAGAWLKEQVGGILGKKPTNDEAKQTVDSVTQKAAEITKSLAEDAFKIFDHE